MAFITNKPIPGEGCKDFKPSKYNKNVCELTSECEFLQQGYLESCRTESCTGIKKDRVKWIYDNKFIKRGE